MYDPGQSSYAKRLIDAPHPRGSVALPEDDLDQCEFAKVAISILRSGKYRTFLRVFWESGDFLAMSPQQRPAFYRKHGLPQRMAPLEGRMWTDFSTTINLDDFREQVAGNDLTRNVLIIIHEVGVLMILAAALLCFSRDVSMEPLEKLP
ncbi:hypothetical protein WJX84_004385 [Apatococcus fuscideae]|uniref:Uncharacterized protein n=1 Tax=Apatococcus fuscideae TaxID=2026836 RepID=A0AAW1SJV3_9CHLO